MLKHRLITGISLGLLGLLPFVLPGLTGSVMFMLLGGGAIGLLLHEIYALAERIGFPSFPAAGVIIGTVWFLTSCLLLSFSGVHLSTAVICTWLILPALLLLFLLSLICRKEDYRDGMIRLVTTFAGVMLVLNTFGLLPLIYFQAGFEASTSGRLLVLYLLLVTKMSDVGAYSLGMLTARRPHGNHKMLPRLSPGKSWEGLIGGLAAAVIAALAFSSPRQALFADGINEWLAAALFGTICALLGLCGDIFASLCKRAAGVKDSGRIPGLGGGFDMLDSLIFTIPLFYAFLYLA